MTSDPKPAHPSLAYDEGTPRSVRFGLMLLAAGTGLAFLVVSLSLIPFVKQWFARDVTLTLDIQTQSIVWRARPTADEPLILVLPPGKVMQQRVGDDFNVTMAATPLAIPAIKADSEIELRMVSRGPCEFDLTARSLKDGKISIFDAGQEKPDLAAAEVIYSLRNPTSAAEMAAPCPASSARYDFFLHNAYALEAGEGVGDAEIPTQLIASTPTIVSGAVAAHNRAWLFDTRYDLGTNPINPGDFVRLAPESSRGPNYRLNISGAVSFTPARGAFDVVAYASSAQAEVEHFGGRYVFSATTWQTIASQPIVQFFFSALAAMLGVVGFVMGIKRWRRAGLNELSDR